MKPLRGAILPLMAIIFVVLLGTAAMAVDLGWMFWNSIEIQHGADAAALSGVVYEPGQRADAHSVALAAAAENGFVDTTLGGSDTVEVVDYVDDNGAVQGDNQLRVTITHSSPTFFLKVFGMDSIDIQRTAVAEYVWPLPMGSPESYFGNDPALGNWPNFWASIMGYYHGKGAGDRYANQCIESQKVPSCTKNDERRESLNPGTQDAEGGYLFGVEVDEASIGATLTVQIFDPAISIGGDNQILVPERGEGTTTFMLYQPDPTPRDTTDGNALECTTTYPARPHFGDFNGDGEATSADDQDGDGDLDWDDIEMSHPGGVAALWETLCTVTITKSGVFPLRVMVTDPGAAADRGNNRYSLRASTSGGPQPRVYGIEDMSIFTNTDGVDFHLAEVKEVFAGKDVVIELWDPGDASGNHSVEIHDDTGTAPPCTWIGEEDPQSGSDSSSGTEASCVIDTSNDAFENWLLTIRISLPADYTCTTDCWWSVHYNFASTVWDTTTWRVYIEGKPIRLIE